MKSRESSIHNFGKRVIQSEETFYAPPYLNSLPSQRLFQSGGRGTAAIDHSLGVTAFRSFIIHHQQPSAISRRARIRARTTSILRERRRRPKERVSSSIKGLVVVLCSIPFRPSSFLAAFQLSFGSSPAWLDFRLPSPAPPATKHFKSLHLQVVPHIAYSIYKLNAAFDL